MSARVICAVGAAAVDGVEVDVEVPGEAPQDRRECSSTLMRGSPLWDRWGFGNRRWFRAGWGNRFGDRDGFGGRGGLGLG